jgi:Galactose binding lectin domain
VPITDKLCLTHVLLYVTLRYFTYLKEILSYVESMQDFCGFERYVTRCQANQLIAVRRALYGRMQPGRCITGEYGHVMGCYADVTAYVGDLCNMRQNCSLLVAMMDSVVQPCAKDFKSYLLAYHVCVNGKILYVMLIYWRQ